MLVNEPKLQLFVELTLKKKSQSPQPTSALGNFYIHTTFQILNHVFFCFLQSLSKLTKIIEILILKYMRCLVKVIIMEQLQFSKRFDQNY